MVYGGKGNTAAVEVRALHAFIRHFLFHKGWDVEKFGEPINQEDQAGTMLAFSAFVIEGLEQLGIRPTTEEKDAYQHTWNVIGHLMGVEKEFMCDSYEEARELGHAILNHQKGKSDTGKALTGACLEFTRRMMPFRILKFVPRNFMYFFMGKEYGSMVGVYKNKNIFVYYFS